MADSTRSYSAAFDTLRTVVGTVVLDTAPQAGAHVGILSSGFTTVTDSGGRFRFDRVAVGTVRLVAMPSPRSNWAEYSDTLEVHVGSTSSTDSVTLRFQ